MSPSRSSLSQRLRGASVALALLGILALLGACDGGEDAGGGSGITSRTPGATDTAAPTAAAPSSTETRPAPEATAAGAPQGTPDAATEFAPAEPFYLEATIRVGEEGVTLGEEPGEGEAVTTLRWSWAETGRFRMEYDRGGALEDEGDLLLVGDGTALFQYEAASNSYTREPFPPLPPGTVFPPAMSALIGPTSLPDIEAFLALWSETFERVEQVGTDEVLGREVRVLEYAPTWRSSQGSSGGGTTETSGGVGRMSIDPESMFALRNTVDGGPEAQSFIAEVTLLDLDPQFDAARFTFEAPEGATEATAGAGSGSSSGNGSSSGSGSSSGRGSSSGAAAPTPAN